jgi:hypothetical protein
VIVGRGATNTKGPQVACLAALHAFKAAGVKPPVNIALVCEGEEEIGSPNFPQIVFKPEVEAALKKCLGVIIPLGSQALDGSVEINLGAKGVVELELVSSGEKWGAGPARCALEPRGAVGQSLLASHPGAQHARHGGRPHTRRRRILRQGATALRAAEADSRSGDPQAQ